MLAKQTLSNGGFMQLPGLQQARVELAWDGLTDADLVAALANANVTHELIFPGNLVSQLTGGAVRHHGDKLTGQGLTKTDEKMTVNLASISAMNQQLVASGRQPITEVAVGACAQKVPNLSHIANPRLTVFDEVSGSEIINVPLGIAFGQYAGAKIGEFQMRQDGTWGFAAQFGGFADLGKMEWALAQDPSQLMPVGARY